MGMYTFVFFVFFGVSCSLRIWWCGEGRERSGDGDGRQALFQGFREKDMQVAKREDTANPDDCRFGGVIDQGTFDDALFETFVVGQVF